MHNLHLDPSFKPVAGPEIDFESFVFYGGEPHIKLKPQQTFSVGVVVTQRINSFQDLGMICMAVDALGRMEASLDTLIIPYFPAARQDRVMVPGEPLSVKVYADIINNLGFKRVVVLDPHSEVTPALLKGCVAVPNYVFIREVMTHLEINVKLVSPDGGALKKIYKVAEYLGGIEVVECSKSRDVKTGKLSGFKVNVEDLKGGDCLIVDDICDGGGTFLGLASELKHKNAGNLYLAVTHGIFSHGLDELSKIFTRIFSTNSIKEMDHPSLTQIPFQYGPLS
jgi:ribose-phosphate pyrophosphokinase